MSHPDDPQHQPAAARFRLLLTGVLAALLVASCAWLTIVVLDRRQDSDDAASRQAEREAVMGKATAFVETYGNYGPDDLDAEKKLTSYLEAVRPLLATAAVPAFEESTRLKSRLVAQGLERTSVVERAGVQSLGEDTAEVVIAGTFSVSAKEQEIPSGFFQMLITLKKIDGTWLVHDYTDADGEIE